MKRKRSLECAEAPRKENLQRRRKMNEKINQGKQLKYKMKNEIWQMVICQLLPTLLLLQNIQK